jgi:glycosyltransferase involved in cell wall biosynthesis
MISVCMAVFNGERYLHEQLDSIRSQLGQLDEVIIVDDGSYDASAAIIHDFQDSRLKLLRNDANIGPSKSFERAISQARGKYIFLSDQDDIWKPNKVETVLGIFESSDSLVVVSDARIIDSERRVKLTSLFSLRGSGPGFWRNLYKNGFIGCCMAFRTDTKLLHIPFPTNVGMHDEWIGLCCSVAGKVNFCAETLIDYRRHGENVSTLQHGTFGAMSKKRALLLLHILRLLPRILKWRFRHRTE